jgi:arylformamidase
MNRTIIKLLAASVFIALYPYCAYGESRLGELLRERREERKENTATAQGGMELAYGKDPLQKLDYWRPKTEGAPLVVFVHGGGWKRGDKRDAAGQKSAHYLAEGYAFASLNYRLVPANTVEEQAQDVADALAHLIKQSSALGFDKTKVALMGHSAGAHLSALVGTDIKYMKKAGVNVNSLRGIIPLDGACYDVPKQISQGGALMHDTYIQAFGNEEARQLSLSPIHHASATNAPAFLILQ